MRAVRWMLAIGYGCLGVTAMWLLARPAGFTPGPAQVVASMLPVAPRSLGQPFVVLLLNSRDCAQQIETLTAWNALHESGSARVVGLVSDAGGDPVALETIRKGVGTRFPLKSISHAQLASALRGLNYRATPVALLIDPQQRLRIAVPLSETNPREAVRVVKLHLDAMPPSPSRKS